MNACVASPAPLKADLKRQGDLVARYGGEEFVCLLPNTTLDGALAIGRHALPAGVSP